MTHEDLRTNIDGWAIGALPKAEARRVEAHLVECPDCQADALAAASVAVGLAESVPDQSPSPAVRARLMSVVAAGPAAVAAGLQPRNDCCGGGASAPQ